MTEPANQVEILTAISDSDAEDLERLLHQLSTTATSDRARLGKIIACEATDLLVIRVAGRIAGTATFVSVPLLSGWRGHVEDVVVDAAHRGRGLARSLLERATELASERGLRSLDLTSRPAREAALRLYESVGFTPRVTNLLRFTPRGEG